MGKRREAYSIVRHEIDLDIAGLPDPGERRIRHFKIFLYFFVGHSLNGCAAIFIPIFRIIVNIPSTDNKKNDQYDR